MEHADRDKCKIVFTLPEAMTKFSGEKNLKLSLIARQRNLLTYLNLQSFERSRYFFLRQKQNSPITSHARLASCKECFHISNRPLPIQVHSHEIFKFLDTETWFLLNKFCQSASLFNFKGKKIPTGRGGLEPGMLARQFSTLTTRPPRNRYRNLV